MPKNKLMMQLVLNADATDDSTPVTEAKPEAPAKLNQRPKMLNHQAEQTPSDD
jgi:hypothetical protein